MFVCYTCIGLVFDLQITREVFGAVKVIELIPGGSAISVTKDNRLLVFCSFFPLFHM